MSDKITIQDIIELLAEKHGMNKKDAEAFVKGIFDLIEEALASEKYVKVKGLGTFKLTEVESRESVNVNTGERFQIQGHNKISFTPDTTMKDLINKPFAHFETVILNENTQLEDTKIEMEGEDDKEENTEEIIEEEEPATPVTLEEALQRQQAKELRKALSLNDRFRFRRELFGNSDIRMNETLSLIDAMQSYEEAEDYILNDLNWDVENPDVAEFMKIVQKHFL